MDQFNNGLSGIDLADASAVDRAFARLQDRVERAEQLLARTLSANMTAAASEATPVDLASAAASAAAIKRLSPAQKTAAIQARARAVGSEQTRREMAAMTLASQAEYEGILHQSGMRYGNRR